ncbi:alpha/beta fold hydrolase [Williamsia sterculiae]|uniref:Alpha/beta hydrolase family protein n=1 Tax=Williamsia sterculiae TaxID=1344003 RepID=A0A1N7D3N8_9NOCA|nr:alpha/beta hydrolase [Williamsia sterculiae]SIR70357.1 Alpha/beta hydrolase family protein [Williamsia sterculiae]
MATYVLVPGAASDPAYWRFVIDELTALGHTAIPVDLPSEDDTADLTDYAETVVTQVVHARPPDSDDPVVVVAHSFGGFTGPLVVDRLAAAALVFVSAMVPRPGERPADWWSNTQTASAQRRAAAEGGWDASDMDALFYNGVDAALVATEIERGQSETPSRAPWPGVGLPEVSTRFLVLRDDRFFPEAFMRGMVAERLPGVEPDIVDGGHMAMLSHPRAIARYLHDVASSL